MTPAALLTHLEARGVSVSVEAGSLVLDAPKGALTTELRQALAEHKPALLDLLTRPVLGPDPELKARVERLARQWRWLRQHSATADAETWRQRVTSWSAAIDELQATLRDRGETWEVYGWICTDTGLWHRVGEAAPVEADTPEVAAIREELLAEAAAIVAAEEAREIADPVSAGEWSPVQAALAEWFRTAALPQQPFVLRPGWRVQDPATFYQSLRCDIAEGPGRGRAQTGALQADLLALRQFVEGAR